MNADTGLPLLTLIVAGSILAGVGCLVLLAARREMPNAAALPWFTAALLTRTANGLLLAAGLAWGVPTLVNAGAALIPLGAAALLAAIRVFHERTPPWWMIGLAAAWLVVVGLLPPRAGDLTVAMGMAISSGLLFGGCFELWRGRAQRLTARWPLAAILGIHAAVMLVAAADVALGNEPSDRIPPLVSWFGLVQFEFILFTLGVTILAVMLCLERIDAKSLDVTRPDTLTGATNRGAFITQADRILDRAGEKAVAVSVIVFDLDGLKNINDTYGHAAGDRVLRVFSKTATRLIRAVDVLGRIGGGEFCVILSDANADAAYVIAERIRHAFEVTPLMYGNCVIPATVSAGVAGNEQAAMAEDLIRAADRALHLAKAHGKNRVEFSDGDTRPPAAVPHLRRVV